MAFRLNPTNQYCYAYSQPGYIPFPVFRYSGSDFGTRCRSTHGASGLPVAISVVPSGKNNLALTYTLGQVPGGTLLQVALVDPMVDNKVPRGENRGRHLEHVQVVRSFQTIESPKRSGTVELERVWDLSFGLQMSIIPTTKWFGNPNHFESSIYSREKVGQSPKLFESGINN